MDKFSTDQHIDHLTPDELSDKDRPDAQEQFMTRVCERLGVWILPRELEDIGLENTPQYDPYKEKTKKEQSFPQLAEKVEHILEMEGHYIGADILLTRGDQIAIGHVVTQSYDANENVVGKAHANLNTRMYQIEFTGSKVTQLTTNMITESIYAQCDADGNEYLPLDSLVDYH